MKQTSLVEDIIVLYIFWKVITSKTFWHLVAVSFMLIPFFLLFTPYTLVGIILLVPGYIIMMSIVKLISLRDPTFNYVKGEQGMAWWRNPWNFPIKPKTPFEQSLYDDKNDPK